jgi:SPP1 family predicted phage head-tail adaptor
MNAQWVGKYRQRVTLQDIPETALDSYGQTSQAATAIGTFWAEVAPLRGDEQLNVRQIWPTATHKVKMRWLGSAIPSTASNPHGLILPRMRLQLGLDGSYLNILFANNVEKRNRQWELVCEEKVLT